AQKLIDVPAAECSGRIAEYALALVPTNPPAAVLGSTRKGHAVHDGVGNGLHTVIGDALLDRRRQLGALTDGDGPDGHVHFRSERREALACAMRGGLVDTLDERDGVGERNWPRPGAVEVTTRGPSAFVMIGVR